MPSFDDAEQDILVAEITEEVQAHKQFPHILENRVVRYGFCGRDFKRQVISTNDAINLKVAAAWKTEAIGQDKLAPFWLASLFELQKPMANCAIFCDSLCAPTMLAIANCQECAGRYKTFSYDVLRDLVTRHAFDFLGLDPQFVVELGVLESATSADSGARLLALASECSQAQPTAWRQRRRWSLWTGK